MILIIYFYIIKETYIRERVNKSYTYLYEFATFFKYYSV